MVHAKFVEIRRCWPASDETFYVFYLLLGGITENDFTYWYRFYRSVVCLFVCLSHSCIVLKRQKISTRFLLHTTAPWLTSVTSFLPPPNFAPKWPTAPSV